MHVRALVFLLVACTVMAGCASRSGGNTASASPPPASTSVTPSTPTPAGDAAFLLMGPILRLADGNATATFHEDDAAFAHYVISLTPGSQSGATAFAAISVNGKVVDVQTVDLRPGESRTFDEPLSLSNQTTIHVEVKVGAAISAANATVARWPRANEPLSLGRANATLTAWSADSAGVHASLAVSTPAEGAVTGVNVSLLCSNASGAMSVVGTQPAPLSPGASAPGSLDFPACAAPYGLAFNETENGGAHVGRILFQR